ncbi:MAG: exonuclease domain-containing protein [Minisyncoccota bacterium]
MKEFVFFDVESTGIGDEDRICQLAFIHTDIGMEKNLEIFNQFFKPPLPIKIDAMAIHHITEKQIEGRPAFKEYSAYGKVKELFERKDVVAVAHNAKFDADMLRKEGIAPRNIICTLKVARHLDPHGVIPSHALQYLRYYLNLDVEDASAHDALGDAKILPVLFKRLYDKMGGTPSVLAEMIDISARPSIITRFSFGKYKGEKIADIAKRDTSYLEWLYSSEKTKSNPDEDMLYTLNSLLSAGS